mmetsp:Transcript_61794/g.143785  ORF Transcript_61794/g.143785 Transcript_61794/m.143785 type:complete len:228 (+) Transcript_61794:768-1451(+)
MNHEYRRADKLHAALVGKTLHDDIGQRPYKVLAEFPEGQHRRDDDDAGDLVPHSHRNRWPTAYGSAHDQDAVQRPAQNFTHKLQPCEGVVREPPLVARTTRAEAVARVLHCKDVHLKLCTQARAEAVALAKVLSIGVKVEDDKPCGGVLEEEARNTVRAPVQPRDPQQLPREAGSIVRWCWGWEEKPRDRVEAEPPALRLLHRSGTPGHGRGSLLIAHAGNSATQGW